MQFTIQIYRKTGPYIDFHQKKKKSMHFTIRIYGDTGPYIDFSYRKQWGKLLLLWN